MRRWYLVLSLGALPACSSADLVVGKRGAGVEPSNAVVPVGIENVNGSALRTREQRALLRFVPERDLDIDRMYFGFKLRGASCWDPDAVENGAGDGGTLHGRLVNVDDRGLPGAIIAEETVAACERHTETEAETGATPVLTWINVSARLLRGQMYGLIVRNAHPDPERNFFSFQMPIADAELAGPQSRNELDPSARGGVMQLDPREHVAWSTDGGESWRYGADNGEYPSFIDENPAHPATRVPQYGFRLTSGENLAAQPFYAYQTDCRDCTVAYAGAHARGIISKLGAFTAESDVGTLTVRNLRSSESASCTPDRGYGFRTCSLESPLLIQAGESYTIRATGSVELMRLDASQRALFPDVGTGTGRHRAYQPEPAPGTDAKDVPSMWAVDFSP